jgi:hypothetical protein
MKKKGTIQDGHNVMVISLSGKQTFVKIFDAAGKLVRQSQTSGKIVKHVATQGEYLVEANGQIKAIDSEQMALPDAL